VLKHTVNHHAHNLADVLKRFALRGAPR
jgi:hypothetical protein